MALLWATKLHPLPRMNRQFLLALLAPAFFHSIGHTAASISFSKLAVSFTQVIKLSEPVFSVAFSALHGHFSPIHIWLSVFPIATGCAIAAAAEASCSAAGLWAVVISNVGFVLRNIYSKQSLYDFKHVDGLNLYGLISVVSLFYVFPAALIVEGRQWMQGFAAIASPSAFCVWVVVSGVLYHLINQFLYQGLDGISPLRFSIGDAVKRMVVIIASVIVFGNPVRLLNAVGSAMAIFGTLLYSRVRVLGKKSGKKRAMMSYYEIEPIFF